MESKTVANKWFWVLMGLILVGVGVKLRWTFEYKFDPDYWEHYYYTSQWNVPNSPIIISDEGVYRYIGYRLVNGENPFNVDYWVPPLGKYVYGLSAKYLSNPYWASWGWYLLTLVISFWISKSGWVVILLATNPLIVGQVGKTMLDLPQATFLLASIGCLFRATKNKLGWEILAGVALGLMMGVKTGYFVPLGAIIGGYYLGKKAGWMTVWRFWLAIGAGYVLAYFCYFIAHPNPIPWIRLHQKVIGFWKNKGLSPMPTNLLTYFFINRFNQVLGSQRVWMSGKEWSVFLPMSLIILGYNWVKKRVWQEETPEARYLKLMVGGWLALCLLVDFWPRYLVAIVPLLTMAVFDFLEKRSGWLVVILVTNLLGVIIL